MTSKTIALTGAETRVDYGGGTNVWLRNDGTDAIYASTSPGITAGADGTASIPAGQAMRIDGTCGTVYLLGTSSVQLVGSDYTACPFKTSAQSGGSGADDVARAAIGVHAGNADIHVTADEKAEWNGKADKSDIPTTLPANGGNAETLDGKHVDDLIYARGILEGTNLDEIQYPCSALANVSCTNKPVDEWGTFLAFVGGSGSIVQLFVPTVVDGTPTTMWMRHYGGTGWSAWRNVSNGGNADTATISKKLQCSCIIGTHESLDYHTILDWATANVGQEAYAFIVVSTGFPSDAPVQSEACVSVKSDVYGRQMVVFRQYGGSAVWKRDIITKAWQSDWANMADGGNATSVGAYTEAKIAALEARIAALEGGGT